MSAPPEKNWASFRFRVSRFRWVETGALTIAFPAFGLLRESDVFFLTTGFPWIVLAPLLAGVRYGFAHGIASALALLLGMLFTWRLGIVEMEVFPTEISLGMLAIGMLAGEFCDMWVRRLQRLEVVNDYWRQRLDEFTRDYHLLKISHDRLEHRLVGSTRSMRTALVNMRRQLEHVSERSEGIVGMAELIMGIFNTHGWIHIASLYAVGQKGELVMPGLARIGEPPVLDEGDALVDAAIKTRKLASARPNQRNREGKPVGGAVLAAIPLQDVGGTLWAVLVVFEMPFVAMNHDHLSLLAVLAGHMADILHAGAAIEESREVEGKEFKSRVRRCVEDAKYFEVPSMLAAWVIGETAHRGPATDLIMSQRRGLDQGWLTLRDDGTPVFFLVMPLTDHVGVKPYLNRIASMSKERFRCSLEEAKIVGHQVSIEGKQSSMQLLDDLRKTCGLAPELAS